MVDYEWLYDELIKNWPIAEYVDRDKIINKTKSVAHKYNPKLNPNPIPFFSTIMRNNMLVAVKRDKERIDKVNNRVKKLEQLGI